MGVSLDGPTFRRMVEAAATVLEQEKAVIDALNVFPVPDGDTGTNMALTMSSALRELAKAGASADVGELTKALALGSLMGARGNSGVILSQLFRGFSREAEGKATLNPAEFAWCLQAGVDTAYKAVMKPVEGTILTVARYSARAAIQAGRRGADLVQLLDQAYQEADRALVRTPDMLPVLKEAGVVDAGGQGLLAILRGYLQAARGLEPAPLGLDAPAVHAEFTITEEMGDLTFIYDTEVLLRGTALALDELRAELGELGDSLLVVGDEETAKVHVHTNNPGSVLERCLARGALLEIEIKNMKEQHEAIKREREAREEFEEQPPPAVEVPRQETGVVAVAVGDGLCRIIRSLGAGVVINGGQTMNPSAAEIVQALESAGASQVIVLPNNSNILLTARQAAELAGVAAHIVPTRTVPQGVAALLAMSPVADLETNLTRMNQAVERTVSGEITYAVRQSRYRDLDIQPGDVIGLVDEEILAKGTHWREVLLDLLARAVRPEHEVLTLYYGQDVPEGEAGEAGETLAETYPDLEVEIHDGGQPLYYMLFSLE
ncbi:MAG: DAK2 domain-containing protein [bacterium]|nr:DAK2 domain-containing protein [bacterium]